MGTIWVRGAWVLAFLLLLAPIASPEFAGSRTYFTNGMLQAQIVLNSVTMPSDEVQSGASTDFSVTFENTGNAATTATAHIYIFDASDTLVGTLDYTAVPIVPNQQIMQQKSWATGALPVGTYNAKGNVTYDAQNGTTNAVSNEVTKAFAIVSGGGGGGGGTTVDEWGILKPVPIPKIPPLAPRQEGPINFLSIPILNEILAGQSFLQDIKFINKDKENKQDVTLQASGIEQGWLNVGPSETVLLPGETRKVDFAVSVPSNAQQGDYLMRLDAKNKDATSSDFVVVRVKDVSPSRTQPITLRTISVDRQNGKTTVSLTVKNPGAKDLQRIEITEEVPKELGAREITFLDRPGEIVVVDGQKYVKWAMPELLGREQVSVSYSINTVLSEYSTYVNWPSSELTVTKKTDLSDVVQIMDVSASAMTAGEKGQVTATVLYVGDEPLQATMTLEAPSGYVVEPAYFTVTLQPRSTFTARFDVSVPQDSEESHLLRFLLFTDDGQVSARLPLVLAPSAETGKPATSALLQISPVDAAIIGIAAIVLLFTYLLYKRGKQGGGPKFDEGRLEYAKTLKRLVKAE